jgi:hypothetical protein
MALNENGNLVDDAGNVVVEFVWGNFPMQPNDERLENGSLAVLNQVAGALLDPALDNHEIAYQGWNGYPLYTPNTAGVEGAGYIVVPSVLGLATAEASRILVDDGLVVTTATAATNTLKDITRVNATSATVAVVYSTGAGAAYPVGTKVTIVAGTAAAESPVAVPTAILGTWTVTASATDTITIAGTGFTIADTTGINATDTLAGAAGTIKTQSVAAGANEIEVGDAITITPWAAATA